MLQTPPPAAEFRMPLRYEFSGENPDEIETAFAHAS